MFAAGLPLSVAMETINPIPKDERYDLILLENQEINWEYVFFGEDPGRVIASLVIYQAIVYALAVYLIRRWSKKWNTQFDTII